MIKKLFRPRLPDQWLYVTDITDPPSAESRSGIRRIPTELRNPRTVLVLVALSIGLLLTELDQSVFATARPTVVGDLGGVDQQPWVGTGYVLVGAVVMPILGRLDDLVGRRRVLTSALLMFVAGSMVGGVARPRWRW